MQPSTIQGTARLNPAGLARPCGPTLGGCLESDVVKRIILAPVPCRHLDSALVMQSDRIAFGTDATHFFEKQRNQKGNSRINLRITQIYRSGAFIRRGLRHL